MEPIGFHAVDPDGPGIHLGGGWWLGGEFRLRYQVNSRLMLESRTGTVSNLDIVYTVRKK